MLLTTTDSLQGVKIDRFLGLVIGHAVISDTYLKNFHSGIRDMGSGHHHDYAQELEKARETATLQMVEKAKQLGANAVIGIDLDFETSGDTTHLVIVSIAGTAVVTDHAFESA